LNRLTVVVITVALLGACTTGPSKSRKRPQPEPVRKPPEIVQPTRPVIRPTESRLPEVTVQRSSPAVIELRKQAALATRANDQRRAIGLLERALRIQPDDPQTYHDLAFNHLSLNRPQQAMQLARKGLRLSPSQSQRDALIGILNQSESIVQ